MPRPKRQAAIDDAGAPHRTATGKHAHIAEIHGESATLGLREWAKRAVLVGSDQR